jgi:hypothetical protein
MESTLQMLLSTQTPLLPAPMAARVYLSVSWGLVLAAVTIAFMQRRGVTEPRIRWGVPLLFLLACLLPGVASPAYWLGLAFRAPSVVSVLLCALAIVWHYRPPADASLLFDELRRWALLPVLLGWVLLLDTFALWPLSLYALGFAPWTLGALMLLGLLPGLLCGAWRLSALFVAAGALYVVLRLPSGNIWDALLDPWLWLLLQLDWLQRALRRR